MQDSDAAAWCATAAALRSRRRAHRSPRVARCGFRGRGNRMDADSVRGRAQPIVAIRRSRRRQACCWVVNSIPNDDHATDQQRRTYRTIHQGASIRTPLCRRAHLEKQHAAHCEQHCGNGQEHGAARFGRAMPSRRRIRASADSSSCRASRRSVAAGCRSSARPDRRTNAPHGRTALPANRPWRR